MLLLELLDLTKWGASRKENADTVMRVPLGMGLAFFRQGAWVTFKMDCHGLSSRSY